jgi:hypothetical protein
MQQNKRLFKQLFLLVIFSTSLLLASCSEDKKESEVTTKTDPKTEVKAEKKMLDPGERAVARWEALIARDWKKAYQFETPAFRKNYSFNKFRSRFGSAVVWKEIKLKKVTMTGDKKEIAQVKLVLDYLFLEPGGGEMLLPSPIDERWLLEAGQWWYVAK